MALDLEAIELIKQLKARYFRAIDTGDMDLLATCFLDNSTVLFEGSDYTLDLKGLSKITEFMESAFHSNVAASHLGHHPEISVSGDKAEGIWYLHDIFYELAVGIKRTGAAIYRDRYVKSDGEWYIEHSGYKRIWERMERFKDDGSFTYRHLEKAGVKTTEHALKGHETPKK